MKKCSECGEVDYSNEYPDTPTKFKREKYGCLVCVDGICKEELISKEE